VFETEEHARSSLNDEAPAIPGLGLLRREIGEVCAHVSSVE
jgi:hypothetical protein